MAETEQGNDPAGGESAESSPAAVATPPVTERPWYERRIDEVTANWRGTERQLAAERQARTDAEAALEAARKGGATIPLPAMGTPEFEAAVNSRAAAQAATLAFNQKCNRIAEVGLAKYPDFDASVGTWKRLGELTVPIVEAADETGFAADIIYELGRNPAEAERILKLPPIAQVSAVMKFAQKFSATPAGTARAAALSGAPEPIKPAVGGGNAKPVQPTLYDTEKLTTEQWIAQREEEIARKNESKRRRA